MSTEEVIFFNPEALDKAGAVGGHKAMCLYVAGLCALAPLDGTPFMTHPDQLARASGVPARTVVRLLPVLVKAGVVQLYRVERADLRRLGYIRAVMPAIPPETIDRERRGRGSASKRRGK